MILTVRGHINGKAPNMTRMGKWFKSGSGARPRGRGGTKLQVSQRCQAMLGLSARTPGGPDPPAPALRSKTSTMVFVFQREVTGAQESSNQTERLP